MRLCLLFIFALAISTSLSKVAIPLKPKIPSPQNFQTQFELLDVLKQTIGYLPFKYGKIPLDAFAPSTHSIPITNFLDTQFFGEVQVGTPGQTLKMMFDTGSSNVFVLAPNCTGVACYNKSVFNYPDSSTFEMNGTSIFLTYGSGNFSGFLGSDQVKIGDSDVSGVLFANIFDPDGFSFIYARFDGIIGMAYQSEAVDNITPFFQVMLDQGLIDDPSFSFYLTKDVDQIGSALVLGGVEERYAASNFTYVNLTHDTYYMTDLDEFIVGNTSVAQKMNVLFDSGSSVIVGPMDLVNKITAMFPHRLKCEDVDSYHNLTFKIGGVEYVVHPGLYVVKNFDACLLGIVGAEFDDELKNTVILGDVFLRAFYTHFDYGNRRLGFAVAANITDLNTTTSEPDVVVNTTTTTTTTTTSTSTSTTTTTTHTDNGHLISY